MNNQKYLVTLIFSILSFVSIANSNLTLNAASNLLSKNHPKQAYELLKVDHKSTSTNAQEWFLLGLSAKEIGKLREAITYLKKVIELDPKQADRAKLELAQIEYQLGNGDTAKSYLTKVKASNPPKLVGDNIDNFLAIIAKNGSPKKYAFNASIGFIHDSNVNAGPEVGSVLMFGLPFTLSTDAKATSDNAKVLKFGANYNTGLTDDASVQSSVSINKTDYNKVNNLDSLSMSLSNGVSYKLDDKTVVSVPVVADWVKIGHDNSYYSYSYGLAPQIRQQLDRQLALNGNIAISRKKYQANGKGDSENLSLGGGASYQIDNQSYMSGGLSLARVNADTDSSSSKSRGINARYGRNLTNGLQTSLGLNYNQSKYDAKEAAYTQIRDDKTTTLSLNANYKIKEIDSDLIMSVSKTKNNSNLPIYQYKRQQVSVSISHRF